MGRVTYTVKAYFRKDPLMKNKLKTGFTTGVCAAACAKAATLMLIEQKLVKEISITLPLGEEVLLPIYEGSFSTVSACCYTVKDAGDDPDITHGAKIIANVRQISKKEIKIFAGKGVGIVTKPGLPIAVGEPAINPIPRRMIISEVEKVLNDVNVGVEIEISIPEGEKLAQRTLNPQLGIIGGLSILGTTGIVKPMSEEAYKDSLVPQLKIVRALGNEAIVLTPGNIGQKIAIRNGINKDIICQTSNFIGFMLEGCVREGFEKILLWGHPGKLLKVAAGNFHTHNRVSDGRMETLGVYLALLKAPQKLIKEVLECATTDHAMEIIEDRGYQHVWDIICGKISLRAQKHLYNQVKVGTVLLKGREDILTLDSNGREIGEEIGWQVLL